MRKRVFEVVIERDEGGWYIADAPALQACHTQGRTKQEVLKNIKEAIELCLEVEAGKKAKSQTGFVGIEKVAVYALR